MSQWVEQMAGRIGRKLERRGLIEREFQNAWLATRRFRPRLPGLEGGPNGAAGTGGPAAEQSQSELALGVRGWPGKPPFG